MYNINFGTGKKGENPLVDLVDEFMNISINDLINPEKMTSSSHVAANILERADDYKLELAAPGLEKKDFKIGIENGTLQVSVNKEKKKVEGENYKKREFSFQSFSRSFKIPEGVDVTKISAKYKTGILTLTLPKREEFKDEAAREINVS